MGILGVFFQIRSPALFEDVPLNDWAANNFTHEFAQEKYEQNAINCWVAAGIYVVIFLFSLSQERMNARGNYEMS
nr:hypothetical protein BaRGS_016283 [Batillaria attramentaria]